MNIIFTFLYSVPAWIFALAAHGCISMQVIRKRLFCASLLFLVPAAVLLCFSYSFFMEANTITLGVYGTIFLISFGINYMLASRFGIPMVDGDCEWAIPAVLIMLATKIIFVFLYQMFPHSVYVMRSEISMNAVMLGYFLSQACVYLVRRHKAK